MTGPRHAPAGTTPRRARTGRAPVLVVDDHPLVREGLVARINSQPDLHVCGEAETVADALALIVSTRPAVAVIDLALKQGSGLDLIKLAKATAVRPRMLVVSAYEESLFAERALQAGAHGYINKQVLSAKIVDAIRTVMTGQLYVGAEIVQRLAARALTPNRAQRGIESLTDRELQVFELIGRGHSTREIAELLHRSVHTIESHREKLRAKLDLRSGSELVQRAVQWLLERSPSLGSL